jgi:hypothetical protein
MKLDAVLCQGARTASGRYCKRFATGDNRAERAVNCVTGTLGRFAAGQSPFAAGDYAAAMRTGLVCRKLRTVGGSKNARVVEEYEINTALIEALNSVEKRAAIETGQEQENVNLTGQISAKSIALSKVMSLSELEALEKKMLAAMEAERAGGKVVGAPKS